MTSAYSAVSTQPSAKPAACHTITALKRWRCNPEDKDLPPVSEVKAIHVYDFDNTLFASPLPNKAIWAGPTLGQLAAPDAFLDGGWWHDKTILAATGEGVEKEEARAWNGWWNEHVVSLVELTMQQKDALCVLLTGRSEAGFSDLIKRIVRSRNLEFHMICLKPTTGPSGQKFKSTMEFKQAILKEMVYTYKDAEEIRIYEDRPKHTKGFRDFFFDFNRDLMANRLPTSRQPIKAEVVQVTENSTQLDPVTEVAEVQRMCNAHNLAIKAGTAAPGAVPYEIKKTVFYTGYMIPPAMSEKLMTLVKAQAGNAKDDIKQLANTILITPKPCPKSILDKVGGIGAKVMWKVTGVSCFENKIWAARVEPVPKSTKIYSENPTPTVVLAIRRGGRPADAARISNWQPVPDDQAYMFETTVEEKAMLRIEEEREEGWDRVPRKGWAHHKRDRSDERDANPGHAKEGRSNFSRPANGFHGRGGGSRGRGGNRNISAPRGRGAGGYGGRGGGGPKGGRGRGERGLGQYRSLDDVGSRPDHADDAHSYY
ncbi:uncharacterized protein EI97DRAFT_461969 [Westerdykella ornata]|uniref:Swiss Army Knife RNA repair protein HAD domain-containing protein n=1 Tax=Westerdykella ornata TaxID=318751 RepID=A0A6A6J8H1_WESOR|nr:uncharacterized protein EI97DRAFT_461969 [Westerdykella ornata]KAF2272453.1 hypothetical protein EI97DRAFT_461969 [Westerdykella ornata]